MKYDKIYKYNFERVGDHYPYEGYVKAGNLAEAERKIERVKGQFYVHGTLRVEELRRAMAPRDRSTGRD